MCVCVCLGSRFSLYTYLSWSSCLAISMDFPDSLSLSLSLSRSLLPAGLQVTSRIGTELLYVGSSWSFYLCSSMWRAPQGYITYELVPTSPAVSCMSGSSNFDSFSDCTASALWGAASMTCSILLAAFLCSYRQAFSPFVLLASM